MTFKSPWASYGDMSRLESSFTADDVFADAAVTWRTFYYSALERVLKQALVKLLGYLPDKPEILAHCRCVHLPQGRVHYVYDSTILVEIPPAGENITCDNGKMMAHFNTF